MLSATTLIAAALLIFVPSLVLKQGYDAASAAVILAIWVAIMAVRALRTPDAVFLQAAGEFQEPCRHRRQGVARFALRHARPPVRLRPDRVAARHRGGRRRHDRRHLREDATLEACPWLRSRSRSRPSAGRAGLRRLLDALAKLETSAHVTVLVADNDAEKHEGFDLCAEVRTNGYRWAGPRDRRRRARHSRRRATGLSPRRSATRACSSPPCSTTTNGPNRNGSMRCSRSRGGAAPMCCKARSCSTSRRSRAPGPRRSTACPTSAMPAVRSRCCKARAICC